MIGDLKPFKAYNHGKGRIDLRDLGKINLMRPTEIHLKEDGDVEDNPSFAIVMEDLVSLPVVGELSLKMLNEALQEIGYELKPIK